MADIKHFPIYREPVTQPGTPEQLILGEGQFENVVPLDIAKSTGKTAIIETVQAPAEQSEPWHDLGGHIETLSADELIAYRRDLSEELRSSRFEFREYLDQHYPRVFNGPNATAFNRGLDIVRILTLPSKGRPTYDVADFLRTYKKSESPNLTPNERATRIMACEGLGYIGDALNQYRNGDHSGAGKNLAEKIGGSLANLHTDNSPQGTIDQCTNLVEITNELLKTFAVYTRRGNRNIPVQDPEKIIYRIRDKIAKSAGFASAKDIDRQTVLAAHSLLPPDLRPTPAQGPPSTPAA